MPVLTASDSPDLLLSDEGYLLDISRDTKTIRHIGIPGFSEIPQNVHLMDPGADVATSAFAAGEVAAAPCMAAPRTDSSPAPRYR